MMTYGPLEDQWYSGQNMSLSGFEPESEGPKPSILSSYTIGPN